MRNALSVWLRRNWLILALVAVNLALAAPAQAGWKNAICEDPEGGKVACCRSCWFFCQCDIKN